MTVIVGHLQQVYREHFKPSQLER